MGRGFLNTHYLNDEKMKYFHLEGEINDELLTKFYEFCNSYEDNDWTISICSGGGFTTIGKTIVHLINQRPKRVTLICQEAYSSAFEIFYRSKCKRILTGFCKGMFHLNSAKMYMQSNLKPEFIEDRCIMQNWKDSNTNTEMAEEFLTTKELIKFKKGQDIYFSLERMKKIFMFAEVI